jgi:hypothetical protein
MRRVLVLVLLLTTTLLAGCKLNDDLRSSGAADPSATTKSYTVPNVVGKNADVAADELKRAGFGNVDLGAVDGHKIVVLAQNWIVKTQSAKAGDRLPANAKIVLGCERIK